MEILSKDVVFDSTNRIKPYGKIILLSFYSQATIQSLAVYFVPVDDEFNLLVYIPVLWTIILNVIMCVMAGIRNLKMRVTVNVMNIRR